MKGKCRVTFPVLARVLCWGQMPERPTALRKLVRSIEVAFTDDITSLWLLLGWALYKREKYNYTGLRKIKNVERLLKEREVTGAV